jgi:lipopolysaccharide/colanic/teichoic acid biosynthesis glycosyltransferase
MFPAGIPISKRIFDLAATSVGLVLMSPILLLLALAVQHGSPVLFTQVRPGYLGRSFKIS